MQDIFSRAEGVLMWLGDDDGDVKIALDLINIAFKHAKTETTILIPLLQDIKFEESSQEKSLSRGFPPSSDQNFESSC
jgi:hypothetical protein